MPSDEEPDSSLLLAYSSTTDPMVDNGEQLLFIYDCETTGGSHLRDYIMDVGSVVVAPEGCLSLQLNSLVCAIHHSILCDKVIFWYSWKYLKVC